jgi:hypothetical protein
MTMKTKLKKTNEIENDIQNKIQTKFKKIQTKFIKQN